MLRYDRALFLDDTRVDDVERALGIPVRIVEREGGDLCDKLLGHAGSPR